MKTSMLLASTIVAAGLLFAAPALAETVTTPTTAAADGWFQNDIRAAGSVAITGTYAPAGETGSLEFNSHSGADKADYVHALSGTLGNLANNAGGSALSFNTFIDVASTTSGLAPAFRLSFDNGGGQTGYLVWETVYNGSTALTEGAWNTNNILDGNFWMRVPGHTVEQFGITLDQWAAGATTGDSLAFVLSGNTLITGLEVGAGSGWTGVFTGGVDHVNASFGTNMTGGISTNFELAGGGAIPEPATWGLMIMGFGGVGSLLRRRRTMGLSTAT